MKKNTIDGYELFFNFFQGVTDAKMIQFGLEHVISAPISVAEKEWELLKTKLLNNEVLFIRGYGRDAKGTDMFFDLYKKLFANKNIKKDPTNNHWARKKLEEWTKVSKKPTKVQLEAGFGHIHNFQVSHVFGCTKNPLLFTAPWNVIFLPKVMDPFTGHEAYGNLRNKFSESLRSWMYKKYANLIDDYNDFVKDSVHGKITNFLKQVESSNKYIDPKLKRFSKQSVEEWKTISI